MRPLIGRGRAAKTAVAFEVSSLLVERPSGVAVYGRGLIRALAALRPDRAYCQVYRFTRARRSGLRPVPELPGRAILSSAGLHRRFGLVHSLDTHLPRSYPGPLIATLFDVISALPLATERGLSSPRFRARKRRDYDRIALRADLVITLSEETRASFLSLGRSRGPVVVIPPGVGEEFFTAGAAGPDPAAARRFGLGDRYLLCVGALCPRKNLAAAVAAFRRARERESGLTLALVGEPARGWESDPARAEISKAGPGVKILGYLPRPELAGLYAGAAAVLYLSHYEGFGLPVLEAMASGAPVVASRRGGIPEAAGEAAILVDPDRPEETGEALRRVLSEPGCAGRLRSLGRARASHFTWERAARLVDAAHSQFLPPAAGS